MKCSPLYAALLLAFSLTTQSMFGSDAHWGYTGDTGPEHWAELDEAFFLAAQGMNQSPIDLAGFVEADLPPITCTYHSAATEILNNGHTIQVNVAPGNTLTLENSAFTLIQYHFHAPSEHTIEGRSFPLEAHFVHKDTQGNLAVVTLLFERGTYNPALQQVWKEMPATEHTLKALPQSFAPAALIPADLDYYRYNGSLTTPPCTEGVRWVILKQQPTVSDEQVKQFETIMRHPNNRPVNPRNARLVLK